VSAVAQDASEDHGSGEPAEEAMGGELRGDVDPALCGNEP
jgi:hypothetical protein